MFSAKKSKFSKLPHETSRQGNCENFDFVAGNYSENLKKICERTVRITAQ